MGQRLVDGRFQGPLVTSGRVSIGRPAPAPDVSSCRLQSPGGQPIARTFFAPNGLFGETLAVLSRGVFLEFPVRSEKAASLLQIHTIDITDNLLSYGSQSRIGSGIAHTFAHGVNEETMKRSIVQLGLIMAVGLSAISSTGCTTRGPYLGPFLFPVPVSPYHQKLKEDEFNQHERYGRVPVMPPIPPGAPHVSLDPPSDDEVMRALERARPVQGGIPFLHEVQRNNVEIVKEKIADYVDPPRVMPLVGPVQLHHAHYKCTVYFTEIKRVGWPFPHTLVNRDAQEVIYIDHNHLHRVGNTDEGNIMPAGL